MKSKISQFKDAPKALYAGHPFMCPVTCKTCGVCVDILEPEFVDMNTSCAAIRGSYKRCEGTDCGDNGEDRYKGLCDKDGCDLNPYRAGNKTFFGPGSNFVVDSTKPVTVVTQFISSDGTDDGDLVEIKRFYVQDGRVIRQPFTNIPNLKGPQL